MAVKRRTKTTKRTATSRASGQAMPAEGASALNFLGLGDTLSTVFGRRRRKASAKRRVTKKTRAKVKTTRARKTSLARKVRRRKTTRRARA